MRKIIQATFILFILLLTACSSARLIYTFIDKFIEDEISYFLDLNDEQKLLLSGQVDEMITWHRKSMMPSYATYLNNIADNLEMKHYNSTTITEAIMNGQILIEETISGLTPFASKFLIQYQTEKSVKFMEKRMELRRQKRLDELEKPEIVLYDKRLSRLISNFERFFGDLTDAQVILLEGHARTTLGDSRIRLENRTMRQKVFINFLRTQPTEIELITYLNKLLLNGHLITNPSFHSFSKNSLERFQSLLETMLVISLPLQRQTIITKIRNYAEDFKAVSG
tara:strand:+ start:1140 stop:1985 length:846 start_codon:yes stop_codon:yes gene_type:complete